MSRFYVKPGDVRGRKIFVSGREAHHIQDVMRLRKNETITAFDGTGSEYIGTIESISKEGITIKITATNVATTKKGYAVTLAQSLPKMDKMDYIVQKACELGAASIIPMNTKRTVVKLKDKAEAKRTRWERIAKEASKQCGRFDIAKIETYRSFADVVKRSSEFDLILMPSVLSSDRKNFKAAMAGFKGTSILVLIGPEGGFDRDEHILASNNGAIFISLGENTLRCDTAAITSIAMINYALSDI